MQNFRFMCELFLKIHLREMSLTINGENVEKYAESVYSLSTNVDHLLRIVLETSPSSSHGYINNRIISSNLFTQWTLWHPSGRTIANDGLQKQRSSWIHMMPNTVIG